MYIRYVRIVPMITAQPTAKAHTLRPTPPPEPQSAPAQLPLEYLRADDTLLVRAIELTEPYDPANTIET